MYSQVVILDSLKVKFEAPWTLPRLLKSTLVLARHTKGTASLVLLTECKQGGNCDNVQIHPNKSGCLFLSDYCLSCTQWFFVFVFLLMLQF